MNQTRAYPGFWHAVLLCFVFVAVQIGLSIPVMVLDAVLETDLVMHPAVLAFFNLIAFALVIGFAWLIGRPRLSEILPLRRVPPASLAGVVVACAGAMVVVSEVDNLVRLVLPMPPAIARLFQQLTSSEHFWASLLLLAVVAPLTEESLFRGLILRGFLTRFSMPFAIILSALLFGAVHLNPWQFVSASALGMMLGWWYTRTQSLIPSLIGHALINAGAALHTRLPVEISGFNTEANATGPEFQPLWFDVLGAALFCGGLWLFHRTTRPVLVAEVFSSELSNK